MFRNISFYCNKIQFFYDDSQCHLFRYKKILFIKNKTIIFNCNYKKFSLIFFVLINNPQVHRDATAQNDPSHKKRIERRKRPWTEKTNSEFDYNADVTYELDKTVQLGSMSFVCKWCKALKWKDETPGMCCSNGKIDLPSFEELPEPLNSLVFGELPESEHFLNLIRKYNSSFQMTSFGAKRIIEGNYMPTFKVQGQVYHLVGSLLPALQEEPKFLQIYFVGDDEREAHIRCTNFNDVRPALIAQLQVMLHGCNNYVKDLKSAIESVPKDDKQFQVIIHADRKPPDAHRGRFNEPAANEVAILIVGQTFEKRDIVLHSRDNRLQKINEIHRSYDALQYSLMFCRGEDGYSISVPQVDAITKQPLSKNVSAASFYSFRIMARQGQRNHLFWYRSLFNQFLVDMYAKIETERLNFIRYNQRCS